MTVTKIGYWRPYDREAGTVIQEPDYSEALRYQADAERAAAGRGTPTREQYFRELASDVRARADTEFDLPVPIPDQLSASDAEELASWLRRGKLVCTYRGSSVCRVCGRFNGGGEMQYKNYVYPSGLAHYVEEHRCGVPGLPDAVWRQDSPRG